LDEFLKDYGLVMDFSNDNIMLIVHRKKWKMWTQKICQSNIKIYIFFKCHQMKNLLIWGGHLV
jgi:hypothetical protein